MGSFCKQSILPQHLDIRYANLMVFCFFIFYLYCFPSIFHGDLHKVWNFFPGAHMRWNLRYYICKCFTRKALKFFWQYGKPFSGPWSYFFLKSFLKHSLTAVFVLSKQKHVRKLVYVLSLTFKLCRVQQKAHRVMNCYTNLAVLQLPLTVTHSKAQARSESVGLENQLTLLIPFHLISKLLDSEGLTVVRDVFWCLILRPNTTRCDYFPVPCF